MILAKQSGMNVQILKGKEIDMLHKNKIWDIFFFILESWVLMSNSDKRTSNCICSVNTRSWEEKNTLECICDWFIFSGFVHNWTYVWEGLPEKTKLGHDLYMWSTVIGVELILDCKVIFSSLSCKEYFGLLVLPHKNSSLHCWNSVVCFCHYSICSSLWQLRAKLHERRKVCRKLFF